MCQDYTGRRLQHKMSVLGSGFRLDCMESILAKGLRFKFQQSGISGKQARK